jgi:hypothetical protein
MMDGMMHEWMGWGWLPMFLGFALLVALIVLVIVAILRMTDKPR